MNIVPLPLVRYADLVSVLRNIANQIEAGDLGDVLQGAVVIQGSQLDIFHAGQGDAESAHLLFACAQRKIENAVLVQTGGHALGD